MGEDVEGGGGGGGGISLGRRYLERLKEEERARAKKISMARIRNQVKASRAARDDSDNEVKEEDEGEREEESPLSSYPFEQLLLRHERGHSSKIHKEESLVRAVDGSESGLSSGAARTGTEYEELYAKYLEKQLELDESLRKREGGSGLGGTGGGAGGGDAGGETGEEGRERGEVASLEIKLKESTYELSRVQNELLLAQSALAQSEEEAKRLRKEAMQLKEEGLSGSCINCQTWSTKIAQVKAEAQDS